MNITTRVILLNLLAILCTPFLLVVAFGTSWYWLPAIQETQLGIFVLSTLTPATIFWLFISSMVLSVILIIISCFVAVGTKAKLSNFYTHLATWLMCLVMIVLTIYTFIVINPISTEGIVITNSKKIIIGIIVLTLIIWHLFSVKLEKVINRRIQAYETAKENNVLGRGSVVMTNLLKLCEVILPEILILMLLCLLVSWSVGGYFTLLLFSFGVPVIGNIICDFNTRKEIARKIAKRQDQLVNNIADRVATKRR